MKKSRISRFGGQILFPTFYKKLKKLSRKRFYFTNNRFFLKNLHFCHDVDDGFVVFSAMRIGNLLVLGFTETFDAVFDGFSGGGFWHISSSRNFDSSLFAYPDSDGMPFQSFSASVGVGVPLMLVDFHPFDEFSQRSSITGSVFTDDSDFLGTFSHFWEISVSST